MRICAFALCPCSCASPYRVIRPLHPGGNQVAPAWKPPRSISMKEIIATILEFMSFHRCKQWASVSLITLSSRRYTEWECTCKLIVICRAVHTFEKWSAILAAGSQSRFWMTPSRARTSQPCKTLKRHLTDTDITHLFWQPLGDSEGVLLHRSQYISQGLKLSDFHVVV